MTVPHSSGERWQRCCRVTLGLALLTTLGFSPAFNRPDVAHAADGDPGHLQTTGLLGGPTGAAFVRDGLAYVGVGARLVIVDVHDASHPRRLGAAVLTDDIASVVVDGSHAYVSTRYYGGVRILDVSNPNQPSEVGVWPCEGPTCHVIGWADEMVVRDGRLYAAWSTSAWTNSSSSLVILDVSDPAVPRPLTETRLPDARWTNAGIALAGNVAFIAAGYDGMRIFDVSDPTAPAQVAALPARGYIADVEVAGRYAYVVEDGVPQGGAYPADDPDAQSGIRVYDVATPSKPKDVAFLPTEGRVRDMVRLGENLLLTEHSPGAWRWHTDGGIRVVSLRKPAKPVSVAWYPFTAEPGIADGTLAGTPDGRLYVTGTGWYPPAGAVDPSDREVIYNGLWILDAAQPARALPVVGQFDDAGFEAIRDLAIRRGLAYAAAGADGLRVIDTTGSGGPYEISGMRLPESADAIALAGDHAYVASPGGGLQVLDLRDPIRPTLAGVLAGREYGGAPTVVAVGTWVYIGVPHEWLGDGSGGGTSIGGGLRVVDASDPRAPREAGWLELGDVRDVAASDGLLLASDRERMHILDAAAQPEAPAELGVYISMDVSAGGQRLGIEAIAAGGPHAFLALNRNMPPFDHDGGLAVVSLVDPTQPRRLAYLRTTGNAGVVPLAISVVGNTAYLGEAVRFYKYYGYPDRFEAIDVTRPEAPVSIDVLQNSLEVASLVAEDGRLIAGGRDLQVLRSGTSLRGTVVDTLGRPLAGIRVTSGLAGATSGADGSFTMFHLRSGAHDLVPSGTALVFRPPSQTVTIPTARPRARFMALPAPVSTVLTPAGSDVTLAYSDSQGLATQFVFPSDAVTVSTGILVTPTLPVGVPVDLRWTGHAFEVGAERNGQPASELVFGQPIAISLEYSDSDAWSLLDESDLAVQRWDGTAWSPAEADCGSVPPVTVDPVANVVATAVCRTGHYALFGPTRRTFLPFATGR